MQKDRDKFRVRRRESPYFRNKKQERWLPLLGISSLFLVLLSGSYSVYKSAQSEGSGIDWMSSYRTDSNRIPADGYIPESYARRRRESIFIQQSGQ